MLTDLELPIAFLESNDIKDDRLGPFIGAMSALSDAHKSDISKATTDTTIGSSHPLKSVRLSLGTALLKTTDEGRSELQKYLSELPRSLEQESVRTERPLIVQFLSDKGVQESLKQDRIEKQRTPAPIKRHNYG